MDNFLYRVISHISSKIEGNIHPKHRIMNYHQYFIENIEESSKILDIGCGIGALTYDIAKKARNVVAIDIRKDFIEIATKRFNLSNIRYVLGDALNYEFNETFDYIVLSNVLEHIKNRIEFLKRIKGIAKYILIRVPLINRSWLTLYKKELGVEYRLSNDHYIEYTYNSFQEEIESAGMKVLSYSIQYGEIWAKIG